MSRGKRPSPDQVRLGYFRRTPGFFSAFDNIREFSIDNSGLVLFCIADLARRSEKGLGLGLGNNGEQLEGKEAETGGKSRTDHKKGMEEGHVHVQVVYCKAHGANRSHSLFGAGSCIP